MIAETFRSEHLASLVSNPKINVWNYFKTKNKSFFRDWIGELNSFLPQSRRITLTPDDKRKEDIYVKFEEWDRDHRSSCVDCLSKISPNVLTWKLIWLEDAQNFNRKLGIDGEGRTEVTTSTALGKYGVIIFKTNKINITF